MAEAAVAEQKPGVQRRPSTQAPIVLPSSREGPMPFLTHFVRRPDLPAPRAGNTTYLGATKPGVDDYANDDK